METFRTARSQRRGAAKIQGFQGDWRRLSGERRDDHTVREFDRFHRHQHQHRLLSRAFTVNGWVQARATTMVDSLSNVKR
jgi:hypothetical protein